MADNVTNGQRVRMGVQFDASQVPGDRTIASAVQMSSEKLPRFERPPVVETVLGIQFDPFPRLPNALLGVFWKRLGPEWSEVSDVPPLPMQFERFGASKERWIDAPVRLRLTNEPGLRIRIRNAAGDGMIQLQNGRIHYNWLGHGGADYARYSKVLPEFCKLVTTLRSFAEEEGLGTVNPIQWEVTYVNHLPSGSVWNTPGDWGSLFRLPVQPPANLDGLRFESVVGEWHYEIVPERGRLHVKLQHGRRGGGNDPALLVLTLTARGPIATDDDSSDAWQTGLDLGRATVVTAFRDLTSDAAHEHWGLVHEGS